MNSARHPATIARHPLVQAALDLQPELRERRQEIDELRQLPQDIAQKMAELGFYRLCVPASLGGLDAGPEVFCEVCEALGYANGSAGWCVFISSTSQLTFAAIDDRQREAMLSNPNVIVSSVFADSGTAVYEERAGKEGFRINGHWRWGSSSHNAAWICGALHEVDEQGAQVHREPPVTRAWFKPDELEILDNWHTSGLRGSGSSDYKANNVWLPIERMVRVIEASPHGAAPIFRFPRFGLLSIPAVAVALGMAQSAIDEVLAEAGGKVPKDSRRSLAQRPSLHQDIATAQTDLAAARLLFYSRIDDAWRHAQSAPETLEHRSAIRTANVHAVRTAVRVIDRMYTAMGGTSVFEASILQQHFRDVHVVTQHMMMADSVMELAGRVMLGLDDQAPGL